MLSICKLLFFVAGGLLAAESPTVIVTGKPRLKRRPPVAAEFDGETVLMPDTPNPSLSRALRESPAVMVREAGGEGGAPSYVIRGLDPLQNRYFLEGIPLTDAQFNGGNLHFVPPDAIASSDIYAEGVPSHLGSDGLGGAIDLHLDAIETPSSVATRAGAFGFWNASGELSVESKGIRLHADGRQSREDFSYFDDNGTPLNPSDDRVLPRANNDFRRFSLLPRARLLDREYGRLEWVSLTALSENGVPGPVGLAWDARLSQVFHLSALKFQGQLGDGVTSDSHLFLRVAEDKLVGAQSSALLVPTSRATDLAIGGKLGARTEVLGQKIEALTGATVERFQGKLERSAEESLENRRLEIPVGLALVSELADVRIRPAVLAHYYEYRRLAGTGVDRSLFLLSPRLGVVWEPLRALRLRTSLGRFYRAPSMQELFGSPAGISPSAELIPETAEKIEAGLDTELGGSVRLSYTYSLTRARDLISYVVNSQSSRVAVNVGEAMIQAHEIGAEVRPKAWPVSLKTAFQWLSPENRSSTVYQNGKDLPFRPPYRAELGVLYAEERWTAGYSVSFLGPMYADLANLKKRGATWEHGAYIEWRTKSLGSFGLEARNLSDSVTATSESGSYRWIDNTTGYAGYPAPGRRWYLSWKSEL